MQEPWSYLLTILWVRSSAGHSRDDVSLITSVCCPSWGGDGGDCFSSTVIIWLRFYFPYRLHFGGSFPMVIWQVLTAWWSESSETSFMVPDFFGRKVKGANFKRRRNGLHLVRDGKICTDRKGRNWWSPRWRVSARDFLLRIAQTFLNITWTRDKWDLRNTCKPINIVSRNNAHPYHMKCTHVF